MAPLLLLRGGSERDVAYDATQPEVTRTKFGPVSETDFVQVSGGEFDTKRVDEVLRNISINMTTKEKDVLR